MIAFNSIKELINTLSWAKDLFSEMFEKRKSFTFKYEQATEILDESRVEALIERGLINKNGNLIEIDDQFLLFFEQILEVNEEINLSYIHEHIQQLKQNITYYLQEDNKNRKYKYLKLVKSDLRKIGRITIRNIIDLNRNIENIFKTEPNYTIKISKLEHYDKKREDISMLIEQTERMVNFDEITFFTLALDEELKQIVVLLRSQLHEGRHNLIEVQKQIIDYLNQIKYNSKIIEKLLQIKYLKDQFEIRNKTNLIELLSQNNAVIFETKPIYPLKLSLESMHNDIVYESIQRVNKKIKSGVRPTFQTAGEIAENYLHTETETEQFLNLEEIKNSFYASGNHLFDFVLHYSYPKKLSFEEKLTVYCHLVSLYESEFTITNNYAQYENTEYVIIYPG